MLFKPILIENYLSQINLVLINLTLFQLDMQPHLLSILEKLISFPSITPKGQDALIYIEELLSELGFICQLKAFGSGEEKTYNLYGRYGQGEPNICFAGHVDVVPPLNEELWLANPYHLHQVGDRLYGRGSVDMKGAIACYLAAIKAYLAKHKPQGSISFLLTSDEEGTAQYGTKMMLKELQEQQEKIDFCILGEPTSQKQFGDIVKIGRRGSISFELKIIGKQGHVAYPEKANNPLKPMVKLLNILAQTKLDNGNKYFQPSNLEITSIDTGNRVSNIIPETVTAKFNIRFNNIHSQGSLQQQIEQIIKQYCSNYILDSSCNSLPFLQNYSLLMQKFVDIVRQECQIQPEIATNGGTSDARFIQHYTEVIEFGLSCEQAHKINEYTKLSDLQKLCSVYYQFLINVL